MTVCLGLILLSCQPALANTCTTEQKKTLRQLSPLQWSTLYQAYDTGAPEDLGYTMMAMAFKESTAGEYVVNLKSHDFGVMQISLKTAAKRRNATTYWQKMKLVEELITDPQTSMDLALEELLFWRDKAKLSWRNMVSAYNNGYAYGAGTEHRDEIIKYTRMFMNCEEEELIEPKMFKSDKNHRVITAEDVGNYVQTLHEVENDMVGRSQEPTDGTQSETGLPTMRGRNEDERSDSEPFA